MDRRYTRHEGAPREKSGHGKGRMKQGGSCHAAEQIAPMSRIGREIYNNNGFDYVLQHVYRVLSLDEVSVQGA